MDAHLCDPVAEVCVVDVTTYSDFDGNARPNGVAHDIGAFVFVDSIVTDLVLSVGELNEGP